MLGDGPTESDAETVITFGGRAFVENPALIERVQGVYLGDTLEEGVSRLDEIMHRLHSQLR